MPLTEYGALRHLAAHGGYLTPNQREIANLPPYIGVSAAESSATAPAVPAVPAAPAQGSWSAVVERFNARHANPAMPLPNNATRANVSPERLRSITMAGDLARAELDALNRLLGDARNDASIIRSKLEIGLQDGQRTWMPQGDSPERQTAEKRLASARAQVTDLEARLAQREEVLLSAIKLADTCRAFANQNSVSAITVQ